MHIRKIIYTPPPDKSITIRALVLGALCGKKIKIKNPLYCDDTKNAIKALKKLGCLIKTEKNELLIKGPGMYGWKKNVTINVGESALFLRLILGVLINQQAGYTINGEKTILRRNFKDTIHPFIKMNAKIVHSNWHLPLIISPSTISPAMIETSSAQVKSSFLIQSLYLSLIHI